MHSQENLEQLINNEEEMAKSKKRLRKDKKDDEDRKMVEIANEVEAKIVPRGAKRARKFIFKRRVSTLVSP